MAGTRGRLGSSAPQSKQTAIENVENQGSAVGEAENSGERVEGSGEGGAWKIADKSKTYKYICKGGEKSCGLALTDKEDSLMCDICKLWFHPKCQGFSIDAFKAHAKYDFIWLCIECKPRFAEIVDVNRHVVSRIDEAEKNILSALNNNAHNEGHGGEKIESKISDMEKMVVEQIKEQQSRTEVVLKAQNDVQEIPRFSEVLKKVYTSSRRL